MEARYNKSPIKKFVCSRSSEDFKELYTIFKIPEFEKKYISVELHEPLQVCAAQGNEVKYLGIGEVATIKQCAIADIDPIDLERADVSFKTKKNTILSLRRMYPEFKSDIGWRTPVTVITVRRFDYDLGKLQKMVQKVG